MAEAREQEDPLGTPAGLTLSSFFRPYAGADAVGLPYPHVSAHTQSGEGHVWRGIGSFVACGYPCTCAEFVLEEGAAGSTCSVCWHQFGSHRARVRKAWRKANPPPHKHAASGTKTCTHCGGSGRVPG